MRADLLRGARLQHFRDAPWRHALAAGLAPITVGFLLAPGDVLTRAPTTGWAACGVSAATAAVVLWTRASPRSGSSRRRPLGLVGLV